MFLEHLPIRGPFLVPEPIGLQELFKVLLSLQEEWSKQCGFPAPMVILPRSLSVDRAQELAILEQARAVILRGVPSLAPTTPK